MGGVVGGVLGVAAVVFLVLLCRRRSASRPAREREADPKSPSAVSSVGSALEFASVANIAVPIPPAVYDAAAAVPPTRVSAPVSRSSASTDELAAAKAVITVLDKGRDADEWTKVDERVKICTQGHLKAYVEERIKAGQRPLIFRVVEIRRVDNLVLKKRFEQTRASLRAQGWTEDEKFGFHGTAYVLAAVAWLLLTCALPCLQAAVLL